MGYGSFYTNVCKLLSSINSGICHRRPSVKLPLSKVGLELSTMLVHLGILADVSVGQRLSRVKGFARLWDPAASSITSSAAAAGYPAMYLTLHLNWDKHKPLYSSSSLAAAPPASAAAEAGAAAAPHTAHEGFTPPLSLNSPTPESIKLLSKPSHQRWASLQELLAMRRRSRPGIFLLSSHAGLITDIDAELRGVGGILLAHLGLPASHVVMLRGLLRQKYEAETAAAAAAAAAADGEAPPPVQHVPLSQWDARAAAGQIVAGRLASRQANLRAASQYLQQLEELDTDRMQLSKEAGGRLALLALQEAAGRQQPGLSLSSGGGSSSSARQRGTDGRGGGDGRGRRRAARS
ncbi:hypothetical protein OEZ85_010097 [Tetradesmus obliquus]|uniref:Uncharacterized protein n=1 Tax=Tetradesmus obliquus TaxID=3088 RepID=A0ABY8TL89_TETOB|nr:hypothetical protein OEZ85_010097 [Tetradesmus obliquus]